MSRPRLFMVWSYTRWGGAQTYAIAIIKRAVADWDVTVLLPKGSSPELLRRLNATGAALEFLPRAFDNEPVEGILAKFRRQFRRVGVQMDVLRVLRRERINGAVVHIEAPPWQDWLLLSTLCLRGAKVFVTVHNMFESASAVRRAIWRVRFAWLSRLRNLHFFVTSKYGFEALSKWLSDDATRRTTVTYPGVDIQTVRAVLADRIDQDVLRRKLGVEGAGPIVLTMGQFVERKGPWILLQAATNVLEQIADVNFVWIAPEPPGAEDRERIAAFGLEESFTVVPAASIGGAHESVLQMLTIADIFVLPSFLEGFPIALVEAMSMGVPCISTPVQGIPEAILDRRTGLLVEPGDVDSLVNAVVELLVNSALAKDLGDQGQSHATANFAEDRTAAIVIREYEQALSR